MNEVCFRNFDPSFKQAKELIKMCSSSKIPMTFPLSTFPLSLFPTFPLSNFPLSTSPLSHFQTFKLSHFPTFNFPTFHFPLSHFQTFKLPTHLSTPAQSELTLQIIIVFLVFGRRTMLNQQR